MALFPLVRDEDFELIAGEGHYEDAEFINEVSNHNWNEDAELLGIHTEDDFRDLAMWLDHIKRSAGPPPGILETAGEPADLNEKQFFAFAIGAILAMQLYPFHRHFYYQSCRK